MRVSSQLQKLAMPVLKESEQDYMSTEILITNRFKKVGIQEKFHAIVKSYSKSAIMQ